jgi:hypothetical protein
MRQALGLFCLLLLLYLLTFGGHLYSPDEELLFRTTEALTTRGSLAIEPLGGFATRAPGAPRSDGREFAQYGIGQPLLAIPFYWLGVGLGHLAPEQAWLALQKRMFVYEPSLSVAEMSARMGVSLFNTVVMALSGAVLFLLARRLCGRNKPAWIAALCWGAGSMAWPHARTFFSEPLAGLCLLVALHQLSRMFASQPVSRSASQSASQPANQSEPIADYGLRIADCAPSDQDHRHSARSPQYSVLRALPALWAGIAAGYAFLVRADSIFFLPALGLLAMFGNMTMGSAESASRVNAPYVLGKALRHCFRGSTLARAFLFAFPVALAGSLTLLLNSLHYGHVFASGYSDQPEGIRFSTPLLAGLYGFFMSVGKGVFFFSPVLVLALWGVRPMLRAQPIFGAAVLLAFASFLVPMCAWRNWAGGWCWGPRHIMQIHALLALPIAFWIAERWNPVRRVALTTLLVVSTAVQLYGCSQNFMTFYRLYFQDPNPRLPKTHPLYDPGFEGAAPGRFSVFPCDPRTGLPRIPTDPATGKPVLERDPRTGMIPGEAPLTQLPAPINDSIYVVQNSQWPRYAEMWRIGLHDFFWLHVCGL